MTTAESSPKKPLTPLWIIALFVSLTETVLGIAVTQTTGTIQLALTGFVVIFPVFLAGGFFRILWSRPYVLYPPTEYGATTGVDAYVQAMNRGARPGDGLYSSIQETIRSTITSTEVSASLAQALSPQVGRNVEARITAILDRAAEATVERIRNANFLTIDSRPLLQQDGRVWEVSHEKFLTVSSLLDELWYSMRPHLPSLSYASRWVLREKDSGRVFERMGRTWAGGRMDTRTLQEVGIKPGMELEVVPVSGWDVHCSPSGFGSFNEQQPPIKMR